MQAPEKRNLSRNLLKSLLGNLSESLLMQEQYIKPQEESQVVILTDKSGTGRERPWREKKMANELLSVAYEEVNARKAERLRECGQFLSFSVGENGKKRLNHMSSCRVRLCPLCAWRRSMKVHAHTTQILDAMAGDYAYIFLTLTVRNCAADELSGTIDSIMAAWKRFEQRRAFKKAVKGWYRGLEVTHNVDPFSPSYDTFHPHFHTLLAVRKGYFTSQKYLKKDDWADLWRQSLKADYEPVVDVRRVKGTNSRAVAEAAKYTVKDADYIIPDDWDLTVDTVRILDAALDARRLVAYGGVMKDWHKKLNLDDEVDGDLIYVDDDVSVDAETSREEVYFWHTGYSQYIRRT